MSFKEDLHEFAGNPITHVGMVGLMIIVVGYVIYRRVIQEE